MSSPGASSAPDSRREPEITVVICTRDRAQQLHALLESVCALSTPKGLDWEICVVDNGSSDGTRQVIESFVGRIPIRYVREDAAGLSNARNQGVAEARGRYICWTDDDVELDPDWLNAYAQAFRRHPDAVVFGGRILPQLEGPSPPWFAALADRWPLTTLLAARDLGDEISALTLEDGRVPWGANFAIRTAEQRQHAYDPNLGVSPNQHRLGEEAELIFRILSAGATGWWVPDAKVRHIIPTGRQSRRYVYQYFFASGETLAYLEAVSPGSHHLQHTRSTQSLLSASTPLSIRRLLIRVLYGAVALFGTNLTCLYLLCQLGVLDGMSAYRSRHAGAHP